ncbi:MAG: hypothetical protein AAF270_10570 [Pseudomonadota bacterium]
MSTDSPDNIRALHAPRREIRFGWQLGEYVLRYDDTTLHVEWSVKGQRRVTRHDLLLLSPLYIEDSTQLDSLLPTAQKTALFSAATLIIWFSDINAMVPLLAPALAIMSAGWLARLISEARVRGARTVICESGGEEVIDIPHDRVNEDQRLGFEAGLKKAIETVHKQWRDGEI